MYTVTLLDPSYNLYIYTGVRIKYLPYSPDLNPIEEVFSKIKHFICRQNTYYNMTTSDSILFNMYEVMDIITPEDADRHFIHTGYY
jgi:hypothetical protein